MKRWIRYLYEYEQDKRLRNVGFVKAEQDEETCVLHIHGRGMMPRKRETLQIYLLLAEETQCYAIWQGETDNVNPAINYRMQYSAAGIGGREPFAKVEGVLLLAEDGRRFAALWEERPVNISKVPVLETGTLIAPEKCPAEEDPEESPAEEDPEEHPAEEDPEESPVEEEPEEHSAEVEPEESPTEAEAAGEPEQTEERPGFCCTKIQRKDLARLPRCEWKLSNNSFLLHGYYNYRHLVFLDDGEWLRLGVPGIYHPREAKAAAAFGFAEFIRRRDIEVELADEEADEQEEFGYWCRLIKRLEPGNRR